MHHASAVIDSTATAAGLPLISTPIKCCGSSSAVHQCGWSRVQICRRQPNAPCRFSVAGATVYDSGSGTAQRQHTTSQIAARGSTQRLPADRVACDICGEGDEKRKKRDIDSAVLNYTGQFDKAGSRASFVVWYDVTAGNVFRLYSEWLNGCHHRQIKKIHGPSRVMIGRNHSHDQ